MNEITNGVNEIAREEAVGSHLHCENGEGMKPARQT